MPQGLAHLHEKFGDDGTAWEFLEGRGFTHFKSVIKIPNWELTQEEHDAIDYLCMEWDWACDAG